MKRIFAFWYDFIVAVGVIVALAMTYVISATAKPAWWVLPVAVAILLPWSLWRARAGAHPADPTSERTKSSPGGERLSEPRSDAD